MFLKEKQQVQPQLAKVCACSFDTQFDTTPGKK